MWLKTVRCRFASGRGPSNPPVMAYLRRPGQLAASARILSRSFDRIRDPAEVVAVERLGHRHGSYSIRRTRAVVDRLILPQTGPVARQRKNDKHGTAPL